MCFEGSKNQQREFRAIVDLRALGAMAQSERERERERERTHHNIENKENEKKGNTYA